MIRLFDNGSDGTVMANTQSRVLWLGLSEAARQVTLQQVFAHPEGVSAAAMGNAQRLENGNVLVGWGTAARISEFSPTGQVVFDATLPSVSYRAYRHTWRCVCGLGSSANPQLDVGSPCGWGWTRSGRQSPCRYHRDSIPFCCRAALGFARTVALASTHG